MRRTVGHPCAAERIEVGKVSFGHHLQSMQLRRAAWARAPAIRRYSLALAEPECQREPDAHLRIRLSRTATRAARPCRTSTDDPLTICPSCGGSLRKVFGNVGIVFKGSGFYKTDNRQTGAHSSSSAGDSASGESSPSTSTKERRPGSNESGARTEGSSSGTPPRQEPGRPGASEQLTGALVELRLYSPLIAMIADGKGHPEGGAPGATRRRCRSRVTCCSIRWIVEAIVISRTGSARRAVADHTAPRRRLRSRRSPD